MLQITTLLTIILYFIFHNKQSIGDWFGDKADDAKDATEDLMDDAKKSIKKIS